MDYPTALTPENTLFILLAFEGPDRYSLAGGLGTRVTELSETLARRGYPTHLIFVGDPQLPGTEERLDGRLHYHRWCQWISQYYPGGVYQGEEEKLYDFTESVPGFVAEHLAAPAIAAGRTVVVLGEEWHTAEAMCRVSDALHNAGRRGRAILFWNANNLMGFHRINWGRLAFTTTITTVSRYMKHRLWAYGVNPLVIPNGIPARLLEPVDPALVQRLRQIIGPALFLFKIGRWDPDKRWNMAVAAAAQLKALGYPVRFLVRGGVEPHEGEVLHNAQQWGLRVQTVPASGRTLSDCLAALEGAARSEADLLNLKFFLPESFLRGLYAASDAVLANSGHEPFGLVGLEVMAAGGIAFTGATGEDYAVPFENAVVLDTDDPAEIVAGVLTLRSAPALAARLRQNARQSAARFTWENVVGLLCQKLEFVGRRSGVLPPLTAAPAGHGG